MAYNGGHLSQRLPPWGVLGAPLVTQTEERAVLTPTDQEIANALATGQHLASYRWGTMWVSREGRYVSFAWKAWMLALVIVVAVALFLTRQG